MTKPCFHLSLWHFCFPFLPLRLSWTMDGHRNQVYGNTFCFEIEMIIVLCALVQKILMCPDNVHNFREKCSTMLFKILLILYHSCFDKPDLHSHLFQCVYIQFCSIFCMCRLCLYHRFKILNQSLFVAGLSLVLPYIVCGSAHLLKVFGVFC